MVLYAVVGRSEFHNSFRSLLLEAAIIQYGFSTDAADAAAIAAFHASICGGVPTSNGPGMSHSRSEGMRKADECWDDCGQTDGVHFTSIWLFVSRKIQRYSWKYRWMLARGRDPLRAQRSSFSCEPISRFRAVHHAAQSPPLASQVWPITCILS